MDTQLRDLVLEATQGNTAAADFVLKMIHVLHLWDDLIDRDRPVSDEEVNRGFQFLLVDIPRNPFYAQHFTALNTLVSTAITNWHVATRMEREGGDYEKSIAYILRSSYVDILAHVALIIGGPEWAVRVTDKTRLFTHDETYAGYLENLEREKLERQQREGDA